MVLEAKSSQKLGWEELGSEGRYCKKLALFDAIWFSLLVKKIF